MDSRCWYAALLFHCAIGYFFARAQDVFNTTPAPIKTNFSCLGRSPGFFADVDSNCKIYHTCDDYGNKFTYRCPEETAFRQDALICDHAHLVDCKATTYANIQPNIRKQENPGFSTSFPTTRFSESTNHHRSFSRSFQIIQQPNNTAAKNSQPGFVFSASVFLKNLSEKGGKVGMPKQERFESSSPKPRINTELHGAIRREQTIHDAIPVSSTVRPVSRSFRPKVEVFSRLTSRDRQSGSRSINVESANRSKFLIDSNPKFTSTLASANKNVGTTPRRQEHTTPANNRHDIDGAAPLRSFFSFGTQNNRDYPYLETLRSIQANTQLGSTFGSLSASRSPTVMTDIPIHALTLALKPLVPNELEDDPYYPLHPTSTEAYYTPNHKGKNQPRTTTEPPWSTTDFHIPDILPDLNTLEDLVDRRRLFYIPRIRSHSSPS